MWMEHPSIETLSRALAALDADACVRIVEEVGRAVGSERLMTAVFLPALSQVGDTWAKGLLDDLAFAQAAVIVEQLWALAGAPAGRLAAPKGEHGPTVVVGVISPDIHDIGKNQVAMLLARHGARVHDLGADVDPAAFATKAREVGADAVVVGASTQRSLFMLPDVRSALEQAGVEARLIVGGQAALAADDVPQADAVVADAYETLDEIMGAREARA